MKNEIKIKVDDSGVTKLTERLEEAIKQAEKLNAVLDEIKDKKEYLPKQN